MGDISDLLQMKIDKKCKSFEWFMKEIAYDVFDKYPKLPPNKFWGDLKNVGSGQCLDTFGKHPPEKAGISGCHGYGGAQMFRLNTEGQLTSGEWCMKTDKREGITISYCDMGRVDGPWEYRENKMQLYNVKLRRCLAVHPENGQLILRECDSNNEYHTWEWKEIVPHWAKTKRKH